MAHAGRHRIGFNDALNRSNGEAGNPNKLKEKIGKIRLHDARHRVYDALMSDKWGLRGEFPHRRRRENERPMQSDQLPDLREHRRWRDINPLI
jgi:hypothetical protein